jgi:hypothetical protein
LIWHTGKRFNCCVAVETLTRSLDPSPFLHHPSVAWEQTRWGDVQLITTWLGTEKTPLRLLFRNRGRCFNVTVLAWRKYTTIKWKVQMIFISY